MCAVTNASVMDLRIAVLQRAAELEGGRVGLAHKLHMPLRVVDYWMERDEIPTDVFLAAWDVVFEHELELLKEHHSAEV